MGLFETSFGSVDSDSSAFPWRIVEINLFAILYHVHIEIVYIAQIVQTFLNGNFIIADL